MNRTVTINRKQYEVTSEQTREQIAQDHPLTAANMERAGQAAYLTVKLPTGKREYMALEFVSGTVQML